MSNYFYKFAFMKSSKFTAVILVFVLLAPMASSFLQVDSIVDNYELLESSKEKNQNKKRESEIKDELDEVEKFPIHNLGNGALFSLNNPKFSHFQKGIKDLNRVVLTPPPEFI